MAKSVYRVRFVPDEQFVISEYSDSSIIHPKDEAELQKNEKPPTEEDETEEAGYKSAPPESFMDFSIWTKITSEEGQFSDSIDTDISEMDSDISDSDSDASVDSWDEVWIPTSAELAEIEQSNFLFSETSPQEEETAQDDQEIEFERYRRQLALFFVEIHKLDVQLLNCCPSLSDENKDYSEELETLVRHTAAVIEDSDEFSFAFVDLCNVARKQTDQSIRQCYHQQVILTDAAKAIYLAYSTGVACLSAAGVGHVEDSVKFQKAYEDALLHMERAKSLFRAGKEDLTLAFDQGTEVKHAIRQLFFEMYPEDNGERLERSFSTFQVEEFLDAMRDFIYCFDPVLEILQVFQLDLNIEGDGPESK